MTIRRLGVCSVAALLLLALPGLPAGAVEDGAHEELPSIDEVGTQSETAREFFPPAAEEQPFTEALVFPLMILAFLAVLVIGVLYLKWQPEFEREGTRR